MADIQPRQNAICGRPVTTSSMGKCSAQSVYEAKRIAVLLPNLDPGGAEIVMVRVANGLVARGHSICIIVVDGGDKLKGDLDPRIDYINLHCRRVRYAFCRILLALRRFRPNLVLSCLAHLNMLALLIKPYIRARVVIREAGMFSAKSLTVKVFYPFLAPRADRIICLSNAMIDDLRRNLKLSDAKLIRIYNPVPIREITLELKNASNPFTHWETPIVICGRLHYQKGIDIMLQGMRLISREVPSVRLHVVGGGDLAGELQSMSGKLGLKDRVIFHGYRRDRFRFLRFARLVVSSSRSEGLPNVLLEAISVGTPVVATNCPGGTGEIVKPGLNGWLVEPGNPRQIARFVIRCILAGEFMNRDLVASTVKDFDEDRTLDGYEALLNEC